MYYVLLDKVVIAGGINNAGVEGGFPAPDVRRFQFFLQTYAFLNILWSEFLLQTRF